MKLTTILFVILLSFHAAKGQDRIIKTNGDTISAKITEIGTNAVSYKKTSMPDGPVFVDLKSDIVLIIFSNGKTEYFSQPITSQDASKALSDNINNTNNTNNNNSSSTKTKIEFLDGKYTINGSKASRKDVDRQLASSTNPAITIPLKAAKMTKTAQKIVKITSIPTSIGGSFSILATGVNYINDVRRGRDNAATYVGLFSSLVGTMTLPITNKILKNKSDKMYQKLIDTYNITN